MKNSYLLPLAFVGILTSATHSFAQTENNKNILQNTAETSSNNSELTAFTGIFIDGKTYLHWEVCNQTLDGFYIIYRSVDGEKFEIIGSKEGIGTKISSEIAYYFQDENPKEERNYYKLVYITKDETFYPNAIATVLKPATEFGSANTNGNMSETQIAVPLY